MSEASEQKKMFDSKVGLQAPDLYRELCKPFRDANEAEDALSSFYDELYQLRVKHRVQDVLFVIQATVSYPDGNEGSVNSCVHFGSELVAEDLAAFALGYLSAQRQERTAKILKNACKAISKKESRK